MTQTKPVNQFHSRTLIILVGLVAVLLSVANIIASNTVATTGKKLQALDLQVTRLEADNQKLAVSLSETKSLNFIEQQALSLGFTPVSQTLSIPTPEPLAQAPNL